MPVVEFDTLTAAGFRLISKEVVFKFKRPPGLYQITGVNQVDPQLGANSCAKSTIGDALSWVLFGETIDGVKGEADIKNWHGAKTCKVRLILTVNEAPTELVRTHSPNTLKLNGETVSQDKINNLLGVDHEKFIYSMIIGQFNLSFLDLKPTPKLDLFSSIMSLDVWEDASDRSNELSKKANDKALKLKGQQEELTRSVARLAAEYKEHHTSFLKFEEERAEALKDLNEQLQTTLKKVDEFEFAELGHQKLLQEIEEEFNQHTIFISNLTNSTADLDGKLKEAGERNAVIKSQVRSAQEELEKWKALQDEDACPYCKQPVAADVVKPQKLNLTKKIIELGKAGKEIETEIVNYMTAFGDQNSQLQDHRNQQHKIHARLRGVRDQSSDARSSKATTLEQIRQLRSQIESLSKADNTYKQLAIAAKANSEKAQNDLAQAAKDLAEQSADSLGFSYWFKGFKELRLWVVSDALKALEIASNNALAKLGLLEWSLLFQMERENTTGGISRGFHTLVIPQGLTEPKPFKTHGGGERQRLRVGAAAGLFSLIQSYSGFRSNIEIWDEPTHHMSTEGVNSLVEFLATHAIENNKAIYFIDHNNLESSHFQSVIQLTRTMNGVEING